MGKDRKDRVIGLFQGHSCNNCSDQGVSCTDVTVFNSFNLGILPGRSVAYVNQEAALSFEEGVKECPVKSGQLPKEVVVRTIKINDKKLNPRSKQ